MFVAVPFGYVVAFTRLVPVVTFAFTRLVVRYVRCSCVILPAGYVPVRPVTFPLLPRYDYIYFVCPLRLRFYVTCYVYVAFVTFTVTAFITRSTFGCCCLLAVALHGCYVYVVDYVCCTLVVTLLYVADCYVCYAVAVYFPVTFTLVTFVGYTCLPRLIVVYVGLPVVVWLRSFTFATLRLIWLRFIHYVCCSRLHLLRFTFWTCPFVLTFTAFGLRLLRLFG